MDTTVTTDIPDTDATDIPAEHGDATDTAPLVQWAEQRVRAAERRAARDDVDGGGLPLAVDVVQRYLQRAARDGVEVVAVIVTAGGVRHLLGAGRVATITRRNAVLRALGSARPIRLRIGRVLSLRRLPRGVS